MVARTFSQSVVRITISISSGFVRPVVKPEGKHPRSRGLPCSGLRIVHATVQISRKF